MFNENSETINVKYDIIVIMENMKYFAESKKKIPETFIRVITLIGNKISNIILSFVIYCLQLMIFGTCCMQVIKLMHYRLGKSLINVTSNLSNTENFRFS